MTTKLKPCPFCGGEARISKRLLTSHIGSDMKPFVICKECLGRSAYLDNEQEAIEVWNRRVDGDYQN